MLLLNPQGGAGAQKRKTADFRLKSHFAWRRSATKFRLILTSMNLNGVIARILRFFPPNSIALQVDYVTVIEYRPVFDLSKKQWGRGAEGVEGVGYGLWRGLCLNFWFFFHFKIVHSGAFSYTNSEVSFTFKCRVRYVITVFLAIDSDTDIKR